MGIAQIAEQNFQRHIRDNTYPGRGIVIGRSSVADAWVQIYWIMGRSAHSQNRRFVLAAKGSMFTEPVDAGLVKDPSLIIYEAMHEWPGAYLVTNGDQTQTVIDTLEAGGTFDEALATREREPDPPNYTPRISGMLCPQDPLGPIALNILKANAADPEHTDRFTYRPAPPPPGLGYCITTYMGDGKPLPSFIGEPLILPCAGTAQDILDTYWDALDEGNRVSLAVKEIPADGSASQTVIRNRFQ